MSQKPNILLIVMDDQRADALGCAGSREVRTPHLDRLAARGAMFENCFVTTPICTPARAEILTGCNSFGNGVPWFDYPIDAGRTLISDAFRSAGWHTAYFGKWHNDAHPSQRGFEFVRRTLHDAKDFYERLREHGHYLIYEENGKKIEGHSSELFSEAAIDWLDGQRDAARPWFACLAYHSPHDPFQPPEPYASQYTPESTEVPPNFSPVHPVDNGDLTIRDEQNLPWPRTPAAIRKYRAAYHGMIAHHDACIGRVLDALDRTGQRENTIVVFSSDHGLSVGSHGLLGKQNMYDHSIRVPLFFSGPGIAPGARFGGLCRNTDIFPTLCRLANLPVPSSVNDGRSLHRVLGGAHDPDVFRKSVFSQMSCPDPTGPIDDDGCYLLKPTQRMVRTDEWKLMFYPQTRRYQLFNIKTDPHETLDLLASWRYQPYSWGRRPNPRHAYRSPSSDGVLAAARDMRLHMIAHMTVAGDSARLIMESTPLRLASADAFG